MLAPITDDERFTRHCTQIKIGQKCGFNMKAKDLSLKNKVLLLFLFRPGQAKLTAWTGKIQQTAIASTQEKSNQLPELWVPCHDQ